MALTKTIQIQAIEDLTQDVTLLFTFTPIGEDMHHKLKATAWRVSTLHAAAHSTSDEIQTIPLTYTTQLAVSHASTTGDNIIVPGVVQPIDLQEITTLESVSGGYRFTKPKKVPGIEPSTAEVENGLKDEKTDFAIGFLKGTDIEVVTSKTAVRSGEVVPFKLHPELKVYMTRAYQQGQQIDTEIDSKFCLYTWNFADDGLKNGAKFKFFEGPGGRWTITPM